MRVRVGAQHSSFPGALIVPPVPHAPIVSVYGPAAHCNGAVRSQQTDKHEVPAARVPMTPELITAISSVVIAVLALATGVYQSALTRRHNRQSVRPVLEFGSAFRKGESAGLLLANFGLGPAIIDKSSVSVDGHYVGPFNKTTINHIRGSERPRPSAQTGFDKGAVVGADFRGFLLRVDDFDFARQWHADFANLIEARIDVEFVYSSLYGGEKFLATWSCGESDESEA